MKKILTKIFLLSILLQSSSAFAASKALVEPTGAARDKQYVQAVTWCRKKFSQYSELQIVARWQSHWGKTGWYCSL